MAQQRYQTQFDSYDGLQTVVCAIENFSPDRFLAALQQKNKVSLDYIVTLDSQVLDAVSRLQEQKLDLLSFSQDFNNQFVTRRNHCFSSAHQLLHKIHSGTSQVKRVFTHFTPNSSAAIPRHTPATYVKPSIYERSPLSMESYMPSLWSIESYPEEVQQLFNDLKRFFTLLKDALTLCVEVMRKEEYIRRDPNQCWALYRSFKDDNYHRVKRILKSINIYTDQFSPFLNPAIDLRQSSATEEEFSQKGFHKLDYEDVCTLTVKELVEEAQRGEFSEKELNLFAANRPLIRRLHAIIADFDSSDTCFDAVKMLTDIGMKQINIHQLISEDTYKECLDLIDSVKFGLTVSEDPKEIAMAIDKMAAMNEGELKTLGTNAKDYYFKHLSIASTAKQIDEILKNS